MILVLDDGEGLRGGPRPVDTIRCALALGAVDVLAKRDRVRIDEVWIGEPTDGDLVPVLAELARIAKDDPAFARRVPVRRIGRPENDVAYATVAAAYRRGEPVERLAPA